MFHITLFEPRIAPNTGNIIRLAANNGFHLHLIEPLGFNLQDKQLRRAGLDYRDLANVSRHINYATFLSTLPDSRILACTTRGQRRYDQIAYLPGDILLFGSETSGLPDAVQHQIPLQQQLKIPMQANSRSMNLANAVAVISYEAWRQHDFTGIGK